MEGYKSAFDLPLIQKKARAACIQCSYCSMLCPRHLLGHPLKPHLIMRTIAFTEDLEELFADNEVVQNASSARSVGYVLLMRVRWDCSPAK